MLERYAPDWADRPIRQFPSTGTDNTLFRLGDDAVLRIPKRPSAIKPLIKELNWLPSMTGLPLAVPEVRYHGRTRQEIGFDFGILSWQKGQIATPGHIAFPKASARLLGRFLNALRDTPTDSTPSAEVANHNRGVKLTDLNCKARECINILSDEINKREALALWENACALPAHARPVWLHGDLKADNLIAENGDLAAVIDWGLAAVGDPAVDYAAAWTWVDPENREIFLTEAGATQSDRIRARGWALYCAGIALSYYRGRSHNALCRQSRQTLQSLGLL
ncbi:MAG: phosphotransferase [Rhodobacteraceae bacterium]|nr:phosphotransferase [Paracoccaceae bacterium]